MTISADEYGKAMAARQEAVRANAGRRLKGLPPLPVPPKPDKPTWIQLFDVDGDYIGTWPSGTTEAEARAEAEEKGFRVGKCKIVG